MSDYRYFSSDEARGLRPDLVLRLDYARHVAGVPFVITSGFRTPEENAAAGGGGNSAHLRGWAVDLSCPDHVTRFHVIRGLYAAGFRRIVVYKATGHVHADADPSLDQDILIIK